jgi:hypothetical protein
VVEDKKSELFTDWGRREMFTNDGVGKFHRPKHREWRVE